MQGEQGALTSDPVFLLEPTGGSTGPMEPDAHETFTQHCRGKRGNRSVGSNPRLCTLKPAGPGYSPEPC